MKYKITKAGRPRNKGDVQLFITEKFTKDRLLKLYKITKSFKYIADVILNEYDFYLTDMSLKNYYLRLGYKLNQHGGDRRSKYLKELKKVRVT